MVTYIHIHRLNLVSQISVINKGILFFRTWIINKRSLCKYGIGEDEKFMQIWNGEVFFFFRKIGNFWAWFLLQRKYHMFTILIYLSEHTERMHCLASSADKLRTEGIRMKIIKPFVTLVSKNIYFHLPACSFSFMEVLETPRSDTIIKQGKKSESLSLSLEMRCWVKPPDLS